MENIQVIDAIIYVVALPLIAYRLFWSGKSAFYAFVKKDEEKEWKFFEKTISNWVLVILAAIWLIKLYIQN